MKKILNLNDWARKDHYHFFKQFEEPFFGVCVNVDCTKAYRGCKETGTSFFLYYLHKSLVAANRIEAFRYRISNEEVVIYDQVNASPTINRPDGTFGFAYMDYYEQYPEFEKHAQSEIEQVRNSTGLVPAVTGENVIHYSSVPWISFTALSHARSFSFKDSIPKISFGKMTEQNGTRSMPVSIHAHHGLMDGYDAGKYIDCFQELLNPQP